MTERRTSPVTGRTTLYAPNRGTRPVGVDPAVRRRFVPGPAKDCPFCPGNEAQLSELVDERRGRAGAPWQTRVVMNRFPSVEAKAGGPGPADGLNDGRFVAEPAPGRHELVIESPQHDWDLAFAPAPEVQALIETYLARYRALAAGGGFATVLIYRNLGPRAGASQPHPHSQIVALEQTPPAVRQRREIAALYAERAGGCVVCDLIDAEIRAQRRVLFDGDAFISFVPFAAESPCETWLVNKRHCPSFAETRDSEVADLVRVLRDALQRLCVNARVTDYNLVLESDPPSAAPDPGRHWFLRLYPRPVTPGGFELGTGMTINPSLPERDADLLRDPAEV